MFIKKCNLYPLQILVIFSLKRFFSIPAANIEYKHCLYIYDVCVYTIFIYNVQNYTALLYLLLFYFILKLSTV